MLLTSRNILTQSVKAAFGVERGLCVWGAAKKRGASARNAELERLGATPTNTDEVSRPRPLRNEPAAGTD